MQSLTSSFRDPSGFLFWHEHVLYRQINQCYQPHYDHLIASGLYKSLVEKGLIVSHQEISPLLFANESYKVIKPEVVPFISYPYEWSFSQLKDAALLTLQIQKIALEFGMVLKDASSYNVQFKNGKPIFIDTLSFELYQKGKPWVAYRQFCQHFLAPLALMSYVDVQLSQLMRVFIDGIPLDIASILLPKRTYLRPSFLLNIHMHAKSQKRYEDVVVDKERFKKGVSKNSLYGLIDNLEGAIKKLSWKAAGTEWANYYDDDSYSKEAFEDKKRIIEGYLVDIKPETVWDLGGNDGFFSRLASKQGSKVICFDIDPACVEKNYLQVRRKDEKNLLPLMLDLTNPSGGIGWDNTERMALKERGPADCIFALALVHHLAISNNVFFDKIAQFLGDVCSWLIIEFVPKKDKKVQKLLATRDDIFSSYTHNDFERAFGVFFTIKEKQKICDSHRVLYLMRKKS